MSLPALSFPALSFPALSFPALSFPALSLPALALSALLFGATGCASYLPFTHELRAEHRLAKDDLANLQFYNSHAITLRRELLRGDSQVTGSHKLLLIAGKQIEEVVIEAQTPGVVVGADDRSLRISFEEGTSFQFSVRGAEALRQDRFEPPRGFAEAPDPFPGDRTARPELGTRPPFEEFQGSGFVGSGNYWLLPFDGSPVAFQGKTYDAVGETALSHLVISTESLEQVEEDTRVLPGRKL